MSVQLLLLWLIITKKRFIGYLDADSSVPWCVWGRVESLRFPKGMKMYFLFYYYYYSYSAWLCRKPVRMLHLPDIRWLWWFVPSWLRCYMMLRSATIAHHRYLLSARHLGFFYPLSLLASLRRIICRGMSKPICSTLTLTMQYSPVHFQYCCSPVWRWHVPCLVRLLWSFFVNTVCGGMFERQLR